MKIEQVFIGDIRKCTQYERHSYINGIGINNKCGFYEGSCCIEIDSEIYKEKAILIKFKNGGYVDLENLNSILDYIKISKSITKDGFIINDLMMPNDAYEINSLFVDEDTLELYSGNQHIKSARQLKKQLKNKSNNIKCLES